VNTIDYFVAIGVLLVLVMILFPSKNVFFCNAEDFRRFTQIQNLVDQHMDDFNNERVEQLSILPWDMSKIVLVIWPESTQNEVGANSERLIVKKSIGDSDDEISFNLNDNVSNTNAIGNIDDNPESVVGASGRTISVGYEEVFYYNEVAKADKLF
jgi:hypothetical protein